MYLGTRKTYYGGQWQGCVVFPCATCDITVHKQYRHGIIWYLNLTSPVVLVHTKSSTCPVHRRNNISLTDGEREEEEEEHSSASKAKGGVAELSTLICPSLPRGKVT